MACHSVLLCYTGMQADGLTREEGRNEAVRGAIGRGPIHLTGRRPQRVRFWFRAHKCVLMIYYDLPQSVSQVGEQRRPTTTQPAHQQCASQHSHTTH